MPSIRVKRGEYFSLTDVPQGGSTPSQNNQLSRPFGPASAQTNQTPLTEHPSQSRRYGRQRSQTTRTGNSNVGSMTQRRQSRVSQHIMSASRTSHRDSPRHKDMDDTVEDTQNLRTQQQPVGVGGSGREMVSLNGSHEQITYHGDRRHPGRIGSVLSLPHSMDSGYDINGDYLHHDDIVEHLDVIDPQVATVSTLTDAANTIVFPPLSFYSRKPVIVLPDVPEYSSTAGDTEKGQIHEDNLDRHVEDCLRKRDKFRRIMRGVWTFMKTPMGIIVSIYGFLVVFWGTGIVFFLAKFINVHNSNTQGFWVELCQQVETGLFTATSIGLIPFRVLDTWRVCRIWRYQKLTIKRRQKAGLPTLYDNNDLPDPYYDRNYVRVLTDGEQEDLHYQQHKFMQSMTWYRPHGTFTHRAFPVSLALWICILNDLNSFFQCLLSACMWSMDRFERPAWTTATTLPAAFVAGILAGVFIWWGGKKTRRHEQVKARLRAALAMERIPSSNASVNFPAPDAEAATRVGSKADVTSSGGVTAETTPTLRDHIPPRCKDFCPNAGSSATPAGSASEVDVGLKGKGVMRVDEEALWANSEFDPTSLMKDENQEPQYNECAYPPTRRRERELASVPISEHMTVPRSQELQ